jgi:hypothetical protein
MKFYRLDEIPLRSEDVVFKTSPTGTFLPFLGCSGLAIAALWTSLGGGKLAGFGLPPIVGFVLTVIFALLGLIALMAFRASLKPTNWLLRCNETGVIIKYRSYLNWRFPAVSPQAVGFDYSEIASARTIRERRPSPDLDGNGAPQRNLFTYLDLRLINPDVSSLEAPLRAEYYLQTAHVMVFRDYPVRLLPDGILELRWSSGIRPAAGKAVGHLRRRLNLADEDPQAPARMCPGGIAAREKMGHPPAPANPGDYVGPQKLTNPG